VRKRLVLPLMLVVALVASPAVGQAYTTGIADQNPAMFVNPLYKQLHTRISRYIAPYDVATYRGRSSYFLNLFRQWYANAIALHVQPLVAFYHSELSPTRLPSTSVYQRDVQKFIKLFPHIRLYQPYNEANRGKIPHVLSSPSASQAAAYYVALKRVCRGCTIAGLDVLDGVDIRPTVRYINDFKSAVHRLHSGLPKIWGMHNYSDTNRYRTLGTRAVLRATSGQLWLTETGGVVKFGKSFPNRHGEGLTRASKALAYMFKLAGISRRITRLYVFQWSGANSDVRFDAGLMAMDGKSARPGYVVVCKKLLHNSRRCKVRTVRR
jgi:hypothetical protein